MTEDELAKREPDRKNFWNLFQNMFDYNHRALTIELEGKHVGWASPETLDGRKRAPALIILNVTQIPLPACAWLAEQIAPYFMFDYGYTFCLRGYPLVKLIGQRERIHWLSVRIKEQVSLFWKHLRESPELAETLPFSPNYAENWQRPLDGR
jgi:hypothetical protein